MIIRARMRRLIGAHQPGRKKQETKTKQNWYRGKIMMMMKNKEEEGEGEDPETRTGRLAQSR